MPVSTRAIAVAWEDHRRSRGLCAGLGLPLYVLVSDRHPLIRYFWLSFRTLLLLLRHRPRWVLVQNPSLVLAVFALGCRRLLGYRIVVDAHNEAVRPFINNYWPITWVSRLVLRRADFTIVSNKQLANEVLIAGGRPLVLPDRLPEPPVTCSIREVASVHQFEVMVIATYADDEPINEILGAASLSSRDFLFRFTGNFNRLSRAAREAAPSNVEFTGFLSEERYWALMQQSHVVLDLTLMPDCLVCGAYEALAALRPMVLSNNSATNELFGSVALTCEPTRQAIHQALEQLRVGYARLVGSLEREKAIFEKNWRESASQLKAILTDSLVA